MTKTAVSLTQNVKAAGCAAKLGPADLAQILHNLPTFHHPDVIVGTETNDDAGVFRLRDDLAIVNTVDFFTPIVDDPFTFGQIAATNAISDIYAMGAEPRTRSTSSASREARWTSRSSARSSEAAERKRREAGVVVIGGHSIIDEEVKYGMAVTGEIHPDRVIRNVGVQPGDALVLTKPLGTGIITTALKQRRATQESVDAAVTSMTTLNGTASRIMRNFAVHACSDVTGFALLGHSQEMAAGSEVTIVLESTSLPLLTRSAMQLAEEGHLTGGCRRNRAYLQDKVVVDLSVGAGLVEIGFDPQTSGGLLIALPRADAPRLVAELHASGVTAATIVGHATPYQGTRVKLV